MHFNSIDFALFLPIVFILYWFVAYKNLKLQNILIIVSSYIFYAWWDWKFLILIFISSITDYLVGHNLNLTKNIVQRKFLLFISLFINLGFLLFFKYYNFFLENFITAFTILGKQIELNSLKIILPVGISFYTFQTLSYTIDVYNKKIKSTNDIIAFFAFVSFFPQLIAGPIERASNLLPQFLIKRNFEYYNAVNGLRQILWGFVKKIVIADNCAVFANLIFNNSYDYTGSTLLLGAIFFSFQIYGDFSGYSDIAIGVARLFGFNLMQNFSFPYFSRDIAEFWRRWHISLSTWFRDYVYIPLGGSRLSTGKNIRNILIVFIISGFWHGANWTFIIWGFLNAIYFIPLLLLKKNRKNLGTPSINTMLSQFKKFLAMINTYLMIVIGWIIFRSDNIKHAFDYLSGIFSISIFTFPNFPNMDKALVIFIFILIFIIIEWFGRKDKYAIEKLALKCNKVIRYLFYYILILFIIWFSGNEHQFIYFQF